MSNQCGTILLPGGSGYLGGILADYFTREGYAVVILSRRQQEDRESVRSLLWDGETLDDWAGAGEGRKITWPYDPPKYEKPIDLWKRG